MKIRICDCNNITHGNIQISESAVNVKYALNGTGKTTIAQAISYFSIDKEKLSNLTPFKYRGTKDNSHQPKVEGISESTTVMIFNEDYVNNYVFQEDELVKNSFEIFIKTEDYDKNIERIDLLLQDIRKTILEDIELEQLLIDLKQMVDSFGRAKTKLSISSDIFKALGFGNKKEHIPVGLEAYEDFIRSPNNIKWIGWQIKGKEYLDITNKCPYCVSEITEKKETIRKVEKEYPSNSIEKLEKVIDVLQNLSKYFSPGTNIQINDIKNNKDGISDEHTAFLLSIKDQVEGLAIKLEKIRNISFHTLKDVDALEKEIRGYKIDIKYLSNLESEYTKGKIDKINSPIQAALEEVGKLKGVINIQKESIRRTIELYQTEINNFLLIAGLKYKVVIEIDEHNFYKLKLKHIDSSLTIDNARFHLSYGERNAFALVLFMYDAIRTSPEIVILDDPVTSFDGNKKFATLQMLFLNEPGLFITDRSSKCRTIMLLTHEFGCVIDMMYVLNDLLNKYHWPQPTASFIENKSGILSEKEIEKTDIKSFYEIASANIAESNNEVNKLVYLRRIFEIENANGLPYNILSSLIHKESIPKVKISAREKIDMTQNEIVQGTTEIKAKYSNFDYTYLLGLLNDKEKMIDYYWASSNGYDKLQLYRMIAGNEQSNSVIQKFVNETFHIENEYLFQLNPCKYEIIPEFVIEECDKCIRGIMNP